MPLYEFYNTKTKKHFELQLKIAEKDVYLKENPHIIQEFLTCPQVIDPVRLGVRKVDNGFKEVLQKIHQRSPGSTLDKVADV